MQKARSQEVPSKEWPAFSSQGERLVEEAGPDAARRTPLPPAASARPHTLIALVQHVQTVLGFHILGLHHLELGNGRGQELHFLQRESPCGLEGRSSAGGAARVPGREAPNREERGGGEGVRVGRGVRRRGCEALGPPPPGPAGS